jgi:hypothetical protein
MLPDRAGGKAQLGPGRPRKLHCSDLVNSDGETSIGSRRGEGQSIRVPWVTQLVSQVLPPSGEKACSQVYERGLMFDHR